MWEEVKTQMSEILEAIKTQWKSHLTFIVLTFAIPPLFYQTMAMAIYLWAVLALMTLCLMFAAHTNELLSQAMRALMKEVDEYDMVNKEVIKRLIIKVREFEGTAENNQ